VAGNGNCAATGKFHPLAGSLVAVCCPQRAGAAAPWGCTHRAANASVTSYLVFAWISSLISFEKPFFSSHFLCYVVILSKDSLVIKSEVPLAGYRRGRR